LGGAVNAAQLLPSLRDLYSGLPETYHLQPWELQHVLFSLGYVEDLADEAEIAPPSVRPGATFTLPPSPLRARSRPGRSSSASWAKPSARATSCWLVRPTTGL